MNIKRFLENWILPPAWSSVMRKLLSSVKVRELDKRRYWAGEPVRSPSVNIPAFLLARRVGYSITIQRETRDCTWLAADEKIELPLTACGSGHWRIGFGLKDWPPESTAENSVEITSGEKLLSQLRALPQNSWSDVRIPAGDVNRITVHNRSQQGLWLAHPVAEPVAAQGEIQNIIVIVLDSIAPSTLGAYRDKSTLSYTPYIDAFFSNALLYSRCFSVSEWTMPSLYSIFSARYPVTHGFTDLRNSPPDDWDKSSGFLAELIRAEGYSTMACSTAKVFTPAFGAHSGFSRFFYDTYPESGRTTVKITNRAIEHLEANREGKNFLFLHYIDTHEPWAAPSYAENCQASPFRTVDSFSEFSSLQIGLGDSKAEPVFSNDAIPVFERRLALRMQETDLQLRPLFDYLESRNLIEKSVVILTSDHGYAYPGSGKPLLVDSRVHVPLLIRHPAFQKQSIDSLINQGIDLGPTIAALAGTKMVAEPGRIFLPFAASGEHEFIINESIFHNKYKIAVRTRQHTFHLHCHYDLKRNRIEPGRVLEQHLYENASGQAISCMAKSHETIIHSMMQIIYNHLKAHARAFEYEAMR